MAFQLERTLRAAESRRINLMPTKRRKNDFYPTPAWATEELLRLLPSADGRTGSLGTIFEPCAGALDIARVADTRGLVFASDIDRERTGCSMWGDATVRGFWEESKQELGQIDWVITNPPFNAAAEIVQLAYEFAADGIAMLLRLSYLEPTQNRGSWLNSHPLSQLIVLPRISFTGDGKTDNVTCAWMVWDKRTKAQRITVSSNPKFNMPAPTGRMKIADAGELFAQ